MQTLSFTVHGNQQNPKGNPLGYHRTTQASKWGKAHQKYVAWKSYVQQAFNFQCVYVASKTSMAFQPICLEPGQKAYLDIMIHYANDLRSDPDNVQKGIADALFVNDKNVAGSYDFDTASDKAGSVEVIVRIL